jgi:hypothetical protein
MHRNAIVLLFCTLCFAFSTASFFSSSSSLFTGLRTQVERRRQAPSCSILDCQLEDDPCNATDPVCSTNNATNITTCEQCAGGLFCTAGGLCSGNKTGLLCDLSGDDCGISLLADRPLICTNGTQATCQLQPAFLSSGDVCSSSAQCLGNMSCNASCQGGGNGTTCDPNLDDSQDCQNGFFCDYITSTCLSRLDTNGDCSTYDGRPNPCADGNVCSNGTCLEFFTIPDGGDCSQAGASFFGCEADLACDTNTETCLAVSSDLGDDCSAGTPCNQTAGFADLQCACDPSTGTEKCFVDSALANTVSAACAALVDNVLQCFGDNLCVTTDLWAGSCMRTYCAQEMACFLECFYGRFVTLGASCQEGYSELQTLCNPPASSTGTGTGTGTATNDGGDGATDGTDGTSPASCLHSFLF